MTQAPNGPLSDLSSYQKKKNGANNTVDGSLNFSESSILPGTCKELTYLILGLPLWLRW